MGDIGSVYPTQIARRVAAVVVYLPSPDSRKPDQQCSPGLDDNFPSLSGLDPSDRRSGCVRFWWTEFGTGVRILLLPCLPSPMTGSNTPHQCSGCSFMPGGNSSGKMGGRG